MAIYFNSRFKKNLQFRKIVLTTNSCSPGSSLVGFFIVLFDDSLLRGIFAASVGVDKPEGVENPDGVDNMGRGSVTGVGVVVSAFFRLTPDLTYYRICLYLRLFL